MRRFIKSSHTTVPAAYYRISYLLIAVLFLLSLPACQAQPTASTDRVAPEDWTYDAMMHLAAKGLLPGVTAQRFMGDWLYSREEMAGLLRKALEPVPPGAGEQDLAVMARLAAEFAPEMEAMGAAAALAAIEPYRERRAALPTASFEPRIARSETETHVIGIYDATGLGAAGRHITSAATMSNRRRKFGPNVFPRIEKFLVRGKTPNWEWEIGRNFMWWGPGYSGSMVLSDNSPGFGMLKLGKDFDFGWFIGHVKITQFASSFEDGGERFYLLGRRWEKRFSRRWNAGVSEVAKTSKTPNPLAFILPSLYLYQDIFIEDDEEFNVLLAVDTLYKFSDRFEGYFDFLVDDIKAPSFLRSGAAWNIRRKIGFLVGAHCPDVLGDGSTGIRAEYIFTDPGTYQETRPEFPGLAYTHDGLVIGHPVGSNSEAIYLRIDRKMWPGWAGVVEFLDRSARKSDGPNPEGTRRVSVLVVRDLTPRASITARYDSLRLPAEESRFQLGASYAF